jgi:diguanylate cyclase (GGDEF)-like protein
MQATDVLDPDGTAFEKQRRHWRLAAILFFGGGLGAAPADALHRPHHPATIYLLPALAIASGLVCWWLSTRVSERWLQMMAVVATLEVALTVWLTDDRIFAIYYVFIAVYAAYVFHDRRQIAGQIMIASLAVLAPIAYDPDAAQETLRQGFVLIPTLVLVGGAIAYLRERLQSSEERYRHLAHRDPLTGVGNFRLLSNRLPQELERHREAEHSLALVLIDLDDFKRVNDEHGHQHGDSVLQEVAVTISRCVRADDLVMRHGGDEFSVIAPRTDGGTAEELADRLQHRLGEIWVGGRPVGACTGCAIFPLEADSMDGLFALADARLRECKQSRPSPPRLAGSGLAAGPEPEPTL